MIHALRSQSFLKNQLLQDIANMPTNEVQETLQQSFYAFLGVRFYDNLLLLLIKTQRWKCNDPALHDDVK